MKLKIFLAILLVINCLTNLFSEGRDEYKSPLSIEGMENAVYENAAIKVGKELNQNSSAITYEITYNVNNTMQYGLMSIPKSKRPENGYPVIIVIHGYVPLKRYSTENSYRRIFNYYSNSDFIVIKPDLRGHGRSAKGKNYNSKLSRLYYAEDVLQLTAGLKSLNNVDTNNIFLMGHSNGGDTSLRLMVSRPDLYKGASLWAPVSVKLEESNFYYNAAGRHTFGINALLDPKAADLMKYEADILIEGLLKIGISNRDEISYIDKLNRIKTPVVIRHADTDKVVPYYWSTDLINAYKKSGNIAKFELINYPNDDHNLSKNYFKVLEEDLKWFKSILNK